MNENINEEETTKKISLTYVIERFERGIKIAFPLMINKLFKFVCDVCVIIIITKCIHFAASSFISSIHFYVCMIYDAHMLESTKEYFA